MAAEHFRAAAIVGQRGERLDRLVLALSGAEITFQAPKCRDHGGGEAEILVLTREDRLVLLHLGSAGLKTIGGHHLAGEFQEGLREETLAAIDIDDALIEDQV